MTELFKTITVSLPWNEVDKLVVSELEQFQKLLESNLRSRYDDTGMAFYDMDKAKDIFEMRRVIDALDTVMIALYRTPDRSNKENQNVRFEED